jgi:hypothetical protein
MDLGVAWQLIRDGGSLLLLTVAIIGGWRGWYIWRREYDRVVQDLEDSNAERDAWRLVALERGSNDGPGHGTGPVAS